jgi:PAS domain S-box-containing protein
MATLGEILRWLHHTVRGFYRRVAARLLRRDKLLLGSERRFRGLLEAAPDAIVIVDWHGHIALVNAQAEKLFGYSRDEIIGQNVTDLIPDRFRSRHREHQKGYVKSPETRAMGGGLELWGRRKDGSEFPVEISLSPLQTDQGLLVLSAIRDVTERQRIEAELKSRARALARSNADLEQFAYVASHDLSAPLRVVAGFVELLGRRYSGQLDEDADKFIEAAIAGVQRMQALIDDLLTYSRVGREDAHVTAVDCNVAVQDALRTLDGGISHAHPRVTVGELPTVRGGRSQIEQLFRNLIDNAVKFSDADKPLVEVSAQREEKMWRISVRDNGIGIDPSHTEQIFKMFQRLHGPGEFPGSGIGLAICKRIVDSHGGEIRADPAPDSGTIFSFTLPEAGTP